MKKLHILPLFLALFLVLWIPAAASGATTLHSASTVSDDGSCHVELTMELELDAQNAQYTFPIPADATNVRLGDTPARTIAAGNRLLAILEIGAGSYTATISYDLPNTVTLQGNIATIELQLLSGFDYPIQSMSFAVTLPGDITGTPLVTSGYYQENVAQQLQYTLEGSTIRGQFRSALKDHETLTLTLTTDRAYFAELDAFRIDLSPWDGFIAGALLLAAVYYILTLMPRLTRRTRCHGQPDGITAGELGTCLTACGTDLTMLVISWAQLGYLAIEIDRDDHVTLYKRMEMGNERSKLEMRCFQDLFHRRTIVDGTGQHFATIARKMDGKSALLRQLYTPASGSPLLFRVLMILPSILLGIRMGIALGGGVGSSTVLAILLALFSAALSWFIQSGGKCLPLRDKTPLLLCLLCGCIWMVPGIATEFAFLTAAMVLLQFAAGVAAAYGGKRSEIGIRCLAQIRGLRHFLRTARTLELQQRMLKNADFFYEMAPYALALGLDRSFARRFGKMQLPESSYLDVGTNRPMTAKQWAAELRYAADILNKAKKRNLRA